MVLTNYQKSEIYDSIVRGYGAEDVAVMYSIPLQIVRDRISWLRHSGDLDDCISRRKELQEREWATHEKNTT